MYRYLRRDMRKFGSVCLQIGLSLPLCDYTLRYMQPVCVYTTFS